MGQCSGETCCSKDIRVGLGMKRFFSDVLMLDGEIPGNDDDSDEDGNESDRTTG